MNIREWLNQNPAFSTVAAVVALVCALGYAVVHFTKGSAGRGNAPKATYYYDIVAGTLFTADPTLMPPIETPAGNTVTVKGKPQPAGVRAFIMACGGCAENLDGKTVQEVVASGAKIIYVQKYTEKAKKMAEQAKAAAADGNGPPMPMRMDMHMMGQMVAKVPSAAGDMPKFKMSTSPGARGIFAQMLEKCENGERPKACFPK
jgi:hypothetical protein